MNNLTEDQERLLPDVRRLLTSGATLTGIMHHFGVNAYSIEGAGLIRVFAALMRDGVVLPLDGPCDPEIMDLVAAELSS